MSTFASHHLDRIRPSKSHVLSRGGWRATLPVVCALLLLLSSATLAAAQTTGSSSSYGASAAIDANGTLLGIGVDVDVDVGPVPEVGGNAPPAYDLQDQLASLTAGIETGVLGIGLLSFLDTDVIEVRASSDLPGSETTEASAQIDDLALFTTTSVSVLADVVTATASINGPCTNLSVQGSTNIVNGAIDLGLLGGSIDISGSAQVNAVVFDDVGVRVTLNEQIVDSQGADVSVSVNAIHIVFTGAVLNGLSLTGDIVIGHAEAEVSCDSTAPMPGDLEVTLTANPNPVSPNEVLTLTATITNNGQGTATAVELNETLAAELQGATVESSQGTCSIEGTQLLCELGDLAAGASAEIVVTGTVGSNARGTMAMQAAVDSDSEDADMSDNFASIVISVDRDDDGIADGADNCPDTPNSDQADGDGDGVGDVCDNCVAVSNSGQADSNNNGIGDACDSTDADGDGVPDSSDNCPRVANADQADFDGDGVGDVCDNCAETANAGQGDSDGDRIGNVCDNCPTASNPGQSDLDDDGIGNVCDEDSDGDGDGINDDRDNCPGIFNPGQEDSDGDGLGDVCEEICEDISNQPPMSPSDKLILDQGRFEIEVFWAAPDGRSGQAQAVWLTEDGGFFFFFDPDNVEINVKVLDACNGFDAFWVFISGLTNLEVTVRVRDLASGQVKEYVNEQGVLFQSIVDLDTFDACAL